MEDVAIHIAFALLVGWSANSSWRTWRDRRTASRRLAAAREAIVPMVARWVEHSPDQSFAEISAELAKYCRHDHRDLVDEVVRQALEEGVAGGTLTRKLVTMSGHGLGMAVYVYRRRRAPPTEGGK